MKLRGYGNDGNDDAMDFLNNGSMENVQKYVMPTKVERVLFWTALTVGGLGCGMLQSRSMYLETTLLFFATLVMACVLGRRFLWVIFLHFTRK